MQRILEKVMKDSVVRGRLLKFLYEHREEGSIPFGRLEQAVATSTSQQRKITQALEKVIAAIDQADLSKKEKNEAKSSLRKLLSSKAAAKVLGAGAQSLSTKYFTG